MSVSIGAERKQQTSQGEMEDFRKEVTVEGRPGDAGRWVGQMWRADWGAQRCGGQMWRADLGVLADG